MKVAPGLSQSARHTTSVEVVPPTTMSAPVAHCSTEATGTTVTPSFPDHSAANASRVPARR